MNALNIPQIVETLLSAGADRWNVEAKAAAHGLPESLDETLSAFANMPEGGVIVLGVSERDGEAIVTGVEDAPKLSAALADKARKRIVPPVQLGAVESAFVDGRTVVVCMVPPQPTDQLPFRVGKRGRAYIRSGDGDHELTEQEEIYLVGRREQPVHDRAPVSGADVDRDLVPELLEQYLEVQRSESYRLRGMGRDELLVRTNVVDHESGFPTVAAVYAMGFHPQQFLPHLAVKASARPDHMNPQGIRFNDRAEFAGPVPDLLSAATDWVAKHLMHAVTFSEGNGYNTPELPALAIREIVANALVHRDLSPASVGSYAMLTKLPEKLIVENPGGLWGLTSRDLGKTSPRARNAILYRMCSAITSQDGRRVIEGYATGIPAVMASLDEAFLPTPFFQDEVTRFRVVLSSSSVLAAEDLAWLGSLPGVEQLSVAQKHALVAMRAGRAVSNFSYRSQFPMDSARARDELQQLVRYGLATVSGVGRTAAYSLAERSEGTATSSTEGVGPLVVGQEGTATEKVVDARPRVARECVADAIRGAVQPLSKEQLVALTGLSATKVARALTALKREGAIAAEKSPVDGRVIVYSVVPA